MDPANITNNEILALVGRLHKTVDDLISFCQAAFGKNEATRPDAIIREAASSKDNLSSEYRAYLLDANTLREEAELFEHYERDTLAGVVSAIHAEIYITVFMLKGYNGEEELDSFHLGLLAEHLERPLDLLSKVWSVLDGFSPVGNINPTQLSAAVIAAQAAAEEEA